MELGSFKASIQNLDENELMALLADIRASRKPVTDLADMMERAKAAPKKKAAKSKSVASIGQELSQDQLLKLIAALEGK